MTSGSPSLISSTAILFRPKWSKHSLLHPNTELALGLNNPMPFRETRDPVGSRLLSEFDPENKSVNLIPVDRLSLQGPESVS
jgi:hypothetical protein